MTTRLTTRRVVTGLFVVVALAGCGGGGSSNKGIKASSSGSGNGSSSFCDDFKVMNDNSRDPGVDNFDPSGQFPTNMVNVRNDTAWFKKITSEAPDVIKTDLETMGSFNQQIANGASKEALTASYPAARRAGDSVRSYLESNANTCVW